MSSKLLRLGTLSLLYFVQGGPYGFQTACLPLILRQSGLSFTSLGVMKLLFLPWVCKPLFAPFIEQTKTKRWWLTFSMLALGMTCVVAAAISPENITHLSVVMLLLNLFSAAQDIAVDSLAVKILEPNELGAGNTVQVVAYKAGSVFAGGILLWIRDWVGWTNMFYSFGSMYFIVVALLHLLDLAKASKKDSMSDSLSESGQFFHRVRATTTTLLSVKGTLWTVCFVSFYKLCERTEQTHSLFLVDKGVPMTYMAFWSTVMRSASLAGSIYGGILLSTEEPKTVITRYSVLRSVPIIFQFFILILWGKDKLSELPGHLDLDWVLMYSSFVSMTLTLFCAGTVTTATFTLMMRVSQTAPDSIQGTHYTTLATFEVLGKLVFASVAGGLIDLLGLEVMYVLFSVLSIGCIPFIQAMPKCVQEINRRNKIQNE